MNQALMVHTPNGPGLGNLTYTSSELNKTITIIDAADGLTSPYIGCNNATMFNGYLVTVCTVDSGVSNGQIAVYNMSNPRSPSLVTKVAPGSSIATGNRTNYVDGEISYKYSGPTGNLREQHSLSPWIQDGNWYMALHSGTGMEIWDFTDVGSGSPPTRLSDTIIPNITAGDYTNTAWQIAGQAPYFYVANSNQGLTVIDASNPASPSILSRTPVTALGGFRIGPMLAQGNVLYISSMDNTSPIATVDISNPGTPVLLDTFVTDTRYYSMCTNGTHLILTNRGTPSYVQILDVTDPSNITQVEDGTVRVDEALYCATQDGFYFSGNQVNVKKYNISNPASPSLSGTLTTTISSSHLDMGQVSVLGNVIWVGNDHGNASGGGNPILVHQTAPDTTRPVVKAISPKNGSTGQATSSRIGITLSDSILNESLGETTFMVRKQGESGSISGIYSAQLGTIHFSPDAPLLPNTTYEVVLAASGVSDFAGNTLQSQYTSTFTTGIGGVSALPNRSSGQCMEVAGAGTTNGTNGITASCSGANHQKFNLEPVANGYYRLRAQHSSLCLVVQSASTAAGANVFQWACNGTTNEFWRPVPTDNGYFRLQAQHSGHCMSVGTGSTLIQDTCGSSTIMQWTQGGGTLNANLATNTPKLTGTSVTFTASASGGTGTLQYSFNFGDGSAATAYSTSNTANRTFSAPGHYAVIVTVKDAANVTRTASFLQTVHNALTSSAPSKSGSIQFHSGSVYAVNTDRGSLTKLNGTTLAKDWEVDVGREPTSVAIDGANDAWVVNHEDSTISVVDGATGTVQQTVGLPRGSGPFGIAFSPNKSKLYVTLRASGRLLNLNPTTGAILDDIAVGDDPSGIAVSGNGNDVYVTRFRSALNNAEVRKVSASSFTVSNVINLQRDTSTVDGEDRSRGVPNYLANVTIAPDGQRAHVASNKVNDARGTFLNGNRLDFQSTVRTIKSEINLSTNAEVFAKQFDFNDKTLASDVAFTALGDYVFVAIQGNNEVAVLDAYDGSSLGVLSTDLAPKGLAVSSDGTKLYVHNFMARNVEMFDISEVFDGDELSAPALAKTSTVALEALSPVVLQGKRVFYNAADGRMARDGYLACASCHLGGSNDGRVWDFTDAGEGLRYTKDLTGERGIGGGRVHWTANFDEIQDFENDIRGRFEGTGFLTNSQFTSTSNPLGSPKTGLSNDLDALAAYVTSLFKTPPSPYRNTNGTMTSAALAGQQVFQNKNCGSCHSGAYYHDNARHDVGTIQTNSGQGIGTSLSGVGFDTPSLLGLWLKKRFLHNGQATSLQAVLNSSAHGGSNTLTSTERNNLERFLLELESPPDGLSPFHGLAQDVPSRIEAEDYDLGAAGIAYVDNDVGNNGGGYRSGDVDIKSTPDGNSYKIGWQNPGEWRAYSVNVPNAGTYTLTARVSATSTGRSFRVEVDGQDVTGSVAVPNTGNYDTFQTVSAGSVNLTGGKKVVRFVAETGSFDVNWIEFTGGSEFIQREAESGSGASSAPMTVVSDSNASGGSAIVVTASSSNSAPPANGHVTYNFTVSSGGEYKVWGRFLVGPADDSDDSLWARIDSSAWVQWNNIYGRRGNTAYAWDEMRDTPNGDEIVTYNLSSGAHTLEIAYRENGLYMDEFLITNDLSHVPGGSSGGCTPTTCTAEGAQCGTISNGCTGTLNCGSCTGGDTCSSNQCVCTPTSCAALGAECGTVSNGCGSNINCGSCPTGESCSSNQCIGGGSLPSPWANADIGAVAATGGSDHTSGVFTLNGSGADIWGTADEFQYAYQQVSGDIQITARVASLQNTHAFAKGGVMIRESLAADSKNVSMFMSTQNGARYQRRTATSGTSSSIASGTMTAPYWVRMKRVGNVLTGYISDNGTNWTEVGSDTVSMASSVYVGLAVTSHADGTMCASTFDNVNVSVPGSGSTWSSEDIGAVAASGSSSESGGTFTVTGSGADIWGSADEFHFVHQQMTGDGTLVARVNTFGANCTHAHARGAVMMRNELTTGSVSVMNAAAPVASSLYRNIWRGTANGSSSASTGGDSNTPVWVRLVRSGSSFTASTSTDGTNWTALGTSQTLSMGSTIYAGLAVTSHSDGNLCTVTFDNVSLNGSGGGGGTPADLAISSVSASHAHSSYPVTNTIDNNFGTRWAGNGDGVTATWDLGSTKTVGEVKLAWLNTNVYTFDLAYSTNGTSWTNITLGTTGSGTALGSHPFSDVSARYIRLTGHGNTGDNYMNVTEAEIWGF